MDSARTWQNARYLLHQQDGTKEKPHVHTVNLLLLFCAKKGERG